MTTSTAFHRWRCGCVLAVLVAGIAGPRAAAQDETLDWFLGSRDVLLPRHWLLASGSDSSSSAKPPRPRFFRVPYGYLPDGSELEAGESVPSDDEGRMQFCMGSENAYLCFRRPGDPGGVGYLKVQTLVPLLEGSRTEFCLGLQAVTPAGLESDGLADGHTVLSPTLVWFHDLGGFAFQGFVGQHLPALGRGGDPLQRGWLYGLAVQQPLPAITSTSPSNLHLIVEALGRQRRELFAGQRTPAGWELLPGLHWRVSDQCWMSGGVILPLGATRVDPGLWQLTCRWQY